MNPLVAPRVRSSRPAADYGQFFQFVQDALQLHMQSTQVPEGLKPVLVEDYPKDRLGAFDHAFDVILFQIVEAQPAAMSNDGSRRQQAPMLYELKRHPEKSGYRLMTYGWKDEATIQFTVFAKSNRQANLLAGWFQKFLVQYITGMKYFTARGVEKFYFTRRLEDTVVQKFGQDLYARPLQYHVRLNFLDSCEVKDLEVVHLTMRPENPADSPATELDIRR